MHKRGRRGIFSSFTSPQDKNATTELFFLKHIYIWLIEILKHIVAQHVPVCDIYANFYRPCLEQSICDVGDALMP